MFTQEDYQKVIDALPYKITSQLVIFKEEVVLAGGFIRDTLLGLTPSDIDIFCKDESLAKTLAEMHNQGLGVTKTDCSYTCMIDGFKTQYVYCRIFTTAKSLIEEFDFTCCGVALQYNTNDISKVATPEWFKVDNFEDHTKNRMLVFRMAEYNRGNLGALTRAFRFVAKGWYLPQKEMAKIVHHYIQPNFRRRTDNQVPVNIGNYGRTRSEATLSEYASRDVQATQDLHASVDAPWPWELPQGSTTNEQEIVLSEVQNAVNPRYNPANRSEATDGQ